MSDKRCECQFCIDYKRFKTVLPLVPVEHQAWFESMFDALWNAQEELSWKKHILSGEDQESIETLEHYLAVAKAKQKPEPCPEYAHTCDVVDISDGPCGDVLHDNVGGDDCPECQGSLVERTNSITGTKFLGCSNFPECRYSKSVGESDLADVFEDVEDDGFLGGEHQGDFF